MEQQQSDDSRLEKLRSAILQDLASMSDQLVDNDAVGFEALLMIARNTGRVDLLEKALKKAEALQDSSEKMTALLDLLNEVDFQSANGERGESFTGPSDTGTVEDEQSSEQT